MATLAIMQPYFFPYIGYFALIQHAEAFILFDTAQYDRKGWMHRNRILKPGPGWQYFRAGIKKANHCASIGAVMLDEDSDWKDRILRQVEHYRRMAPHYQSVVSWLETVLKPQRQTLAKLNQELLRATLEFIGIDRSIETLSTMNLNIGEVEHAGQWALRICEALGADEYVNPAGGRSIFVPHEFATSGIRLRFLKHNLPEYSQGPRHFEPGLSILDVLFFNTPVETRRIIEDYIIETA